MTFGSDPSRPKAIAEKPQMTIEELTGLLLTPHEYVRHPWVTGEGEDETYVYELANGQKKITFFGAKHSHDPDHPQFDELERRFSQLNPDMVYLEGMSSLPDPAIVAEKYERTFPGDPRTHGEPRVALKLALDVGVDFESPEPPDAELFRNLLQEGFTKKDIFAFVVYRQASQFQDMHPESSMYAFREYMVPYLDAFRRDSVWDADELRRIESEIFRDMNLADTEAYATQVDPMPWPEKRLTVVNEIASVVNRYRDVRWLERIAEGLKTHDRLFIVGGSGHAVTLEPALRALMESR